MHADLEKLIRLQSAESELKHAEAELAEIPHQRSELAARLVQERSRWDAARLALEESQKARRRLESELQDLETKRSRYKGQLMEVKTNKEYTAMLHEIETVEREIRTREDLILAEMEKAEALAGEVRREETDFRECETRQEVEGKQLDERAKRLQEEVRRLAGERAEAAAGVPEDLLELYQRVARLRGVAVGEVKDGVCLLCHVKVRLQMWVELRRNEAVTQCPACSRVLYYVPPAQTIVPDA